MLVERALVGIVILPVVILVLVAGGWVFALSVAVVLGVAAWEYWRMVTSGGFQPSALIVIGGVALMALLRYLFDFSGSQFGASALILVTMAMCTRSYELSRNQPASDFAITLAGIFYLGWVGSYLISLRNLPNGEWWAFIALPAAWIADMGAFFVGRQFGRHKLAPRVSPKKTWAGAWGGLAGSIAGVAVLKLVSAHYLSWLDVAMIAIPGGILGQLGDLTESLIKRSAGVKDSGALLPGHGGLLDRIDALLFALPYVYYYGLASGGIG